MATVFAYFLWLIQLACLIIILVCCWLLLDRQVFALVSASVTLATTLYIERNLPTEGGE